MLSLAHKTSHVWYHRCFYLYIPTIVITHQEPNGLFLPSFPALLFSIYSGTYVTPQHEFL